MTTKKKIFDLRFTVLISLHIICIGWLAVLTMQSDQDNDAEHWRNVASRLHASGVKDKAAYFYEKYLSESTAPATTKSSVAYSLGELYEESLKPEDALAWYYQVEVFDPKSEHKAAASKKIVALLEKMKKFGAAKRELATQTQLKPAAEGPAAKGAVEVASIGNRKIYLHQVNEALDALPQNYRQAMASKEAKANFLKKYVADELLFDKANRLNYAEDAKLKKQILNLEKQLLVQKVIEEEVQSKVNMDATDVKNYYEANQDKYTEKASATVSLIKTKKKADADGVIKAVKSGKDFAALAKTKSIDTATKAKGGKYQTPVKAGQGFDGFSKEVSDAIFQTKTGGLTKPVLSRGAYYVFKVHNKTPEKKPNFDQAKAKVEFDYRMEKTQNLYQKLIEETLTSNDVKIYAERMK